MLCTPSWRPSSITRTPRCAWTVWNFSRPRREEADFYDGWLNLAGGVCGPSAGWLTAREVSRSGSRLTLAERRRNDLDRDHRTTQRARITLRVICPTQTIAKRRRHNPTPALTWLFNHNSDDGRWGSSRALSGSA